MPTSYLAMPLGTSFKSKAVWDGIVEEYKRKLTTWMEETIIIGRSKGCRLKLSTLSNLPTYMSIFSDPCLVARILALGRSRGGIQVLFG